MSNKDKNISSDLQLQAYPGPPLDTVVNFAAQKIEKSVFSRKRLFKLRRDIGKVYKRVRPCGHYIQNKGQSVDIAVGEKGGVYYAGLQSCNSVWACPVCSLKISQHRANEVRTMLKNAFDGGLNGIFITLTLPHTAYDNLKELQRAVTESFRDITNNSLYKGKHRKYKGKKYIEKGLKQEFDIQGFIRALEVKKGANGWHPHLHVVFLAGCTSEVLEEFAEEFISLWQDTLYCKFGKKAQRQGQDWQHCNNERGIANYISKWDLASELTESHQKERGGKTPFQIFEEYQKDNTNEEALKDFLHYCHSFKGVQQLSCSRGFKSKYLGGLTELTDAEICKDEKVLQLLLSLEKSLFNELIEKSKEAELISIIEGLIKEDSFNYEDIEVFLYENLTPLIVRDDSGGYPLYKSMF